MNRLRESFGGGCCLTVALSLAALVVSAALVCALLTRDVTYPAHAISPVSTPAPFSPSTLRVLSVTPADGSQDVGPRITIEVIFNRPMVDLEATSDLRQTPTPIVILPQVGGRGRWTAANAYQFHPDALSAATRYTVTVPAGTTGLYGAALPTDYTVTFSTVRPSVTYVEPHADARSASPRGEVRVTFSTPMDRRSAESRFSLLDAGDRPVEGTFRWDDDHRMVFTPNDLLTRSAVYRATLDAGARADGKELETATAHSWQFTVAGPPHIISSSPADGDMAAHPEGQLAVLFNVPMDTASVEAALRIEPEPEHVDIQWERDDTRLEVFIDFDPSVEYRILLAEGVVDLYGEPLTGNRSIVFLSAPLAPMLSLYGPYGYYQGPVGSHVADQAVEQFIEVRNLETVTFILSSIEASDFITAYRDRYEMPDTGTVDRTHLHTWRQTLDLPLNRIRYVSTTVTAPDEAPLSPGVYLLQVRSRGLSDARFMVVSRANLALKWGPRQVFVWATDLVSGQVIPDMNITIYNREGALLAEGTTDQDGVFVADVEGLEGDYWRRWEESLFVVGEGPPESGNGLALCTSRWDAGITRWDFGLQQDSGEGGDSTAYVYSDRPIYRPGQTVYFKGIVRADDDGRYALLGPEVMTIPVTIRDSQGNELLSDELPLNEFGTIHGELDLAETAPLGRYTVHASLPGQSEPARMQFTVAEYRKPEFKVEVSTDVAGRGDPPYAVHGDAITLTVQADYYFGQPVPDTEVRWRLRGSPYHFSLPRVWYNFGAYTDHWRYHGEDNDGDGQMVYASGEGRTDEDGQFVIVIPVDLSQSNVSQIFAIEASLTDVNDQEVTGSTALVAHKTDVYLGVRPHRYVGAPDVAQEIDIIALDPLKEPRAGITATVEFYSHRWDSVREKTDSGGYVWRNALTKELVGSQVVTATANGTAQALVTPPRGGEYEVVIHAVDGLGNEVTSSTYLWVWGSGYINWGVNNHDRIQLIADKREYEPGEVAEILVTAPFTGCLALVTIERGGVLSYDVQRLDGTSGLLEVPIVADYAPNAFVSVSLLKGQSDDFPAPAFKLGYVELRVTRREQQLDVTITPNRERYQPGDTATYTIRATDYRGRGVATELSVGVVDAAVLALLGDNAAPILDAFYHRRGLGVWNAQTLVVSVDRLNERLEKAGKGGGGGEAEESLAIRRHFLDTAYWDPVVVTDRDGWAVVQVGLPDDLTTWRLLAKGVTVDTRVGDNSADVISTKDLLVRPVLPRFFTVGDEATVAALVHNYTEVTQTIQFEMQATGLHMPGGPVTNTTFVVAPGEAEKVSWTVSVPQVREAQVLYVARAVGAAPVYDAVETTLPVHAFAETTTFAANERVDEYLAVTVELPYDVNEIDELVIETAPSLGAGIRTGLEYLTGYPYG
ncbi:MAG: Ig-like domain-containing protein [Chloroflexota bacterium]|nr:Ig-like domain-containing protein [Chloroflexota bacterium]